MARELQLARTKVKLSKAKANAYSEQPLYLQTSLEESKSHCLEAERKESEEKKHKELLATKVECLKEELANYKAGEEGC